MKIKKILLLALCLVMTLSSVVIPTGLTAKASTPGVIYSQFDYSNSTDSQYPVTAYAQDVLLQMEYDVLESERAYLETYCKEFSICYDQVLAAKQIDKQIYNKDGVETYRIVAKIYSYETTGGQTITWTPKTLTVFANDGSRTLHFDANSDYDSDNAQYVKEFTDIEIDHFTVNYEVQLGVGEADVLNFAYNYISGAAEPLEFYTQTGNKEKIHKYYEYLAEKEAWDVDKAKFEAYLIAKEKYDADYAKYQTYLVELEQYNSIKNAIDQYNRDLASYNEYLAQLELAKKKIQPFDDILFTEVTYLNRQLYACLFSPLVDEVVGRKEELVAVRPNLETPIDNCTDASREIQKILSNNGKSYNKLTTTQDKYELYSSKYNDLCKYIRLLGESLYQIYTTSGIRALMHTAPEVLGRPDYTEKLSIFIAQILALSDALHDEPLTYTDGNGTAKKLSEMTFSYWNQAGTEIKKISVAKMLESDTYVVDTNNATPNIDLKQVAEPKKPAVMVLPDMPEVVSQPDEIEPVEDPEERRPVAVSAPAGFDEYSWFDWHKLVNDTTYNVIIMNLYSDYVSGNLVQRDIVSDITLTAPLTRYFSNDNVTVTFKDEDGNTICDVQVEKGDYITFAGQYPTKAEDISATYEFADWIDADGKIYTSKELSSVTTDLVLYPTFKPIYKEYDDTQKDEYLDIDIQDKISKVPLEHFTDVINTTPGLLSLKVKALDADIIISKEFLKNNLKTTSYLEINVDTSSSNSVTCSVVAYDKNNQAIEVDADVKVYVHGLDLQKRYMAKDSRGNEVQVYKAGDVYFTAKVGETYSINNVYGITNVYGSVIKIPSYGVPGQIVEFTVDTTSISRNKELEVYYYLTSEGQENMKLVEGNSFVMPEGGISLFVNYVDIIYTVKFESDGKVISENYYKYYDELVLPDIYPTKVNDDKYSYKFIGWSPEISDRVTGSVTYVAQFEATLLPVQAKRINWWRVAVVSAITFVIVAFVLIILLILNKKKIINIKGMFLAIGRLFKGKKGTAEQTENEPKDNATEDTVSKNDSQEEIEELSVENEEKTVSEATENDTAEE